MPPDRELQGKEHTGLGVERPGPATSWTGHVQFGLDSPSHWQEVDFFCAGPPGPSQLDAEWLSLPGS